MALLDAATVDAAIAGSRWERDGEVLVRRVRAADFRAAVALIEAIADLAERLDHHPDICLERYRQLTVRLRSNDEGGITARDLRFVREVAPILDH